MYLLYGKWYFKEKNKSAQKDQKQFLFLSISKVLPDFKTTGKAMAAMSDFYMAVGRSDSPGSKSYI